MTWILAALALAALVVPALGIYFQSPAKSGLFYDPSP